MKPLYKQSSKTLNFDIVYINGKENDFSLFDKDETAYRKNQVLRCRKCNKFFSWNKICCDNWSKYACYHCGQKMYVK